MGKDGMSFVSVPTLQEMFDPPSLTPAQEPIVLLCFHCFLGKLCRAHGLLAGRCPTALQHSHLYEKLERASGWGRGKDCMNGAKSGALRTAWHAARCSGRQALVKG